MPLSRHRVPSMRAAIFIAAVAIFAIVFATPADEVEATCEAYEYHNTPTTCVRYTNCGPTQYQVRWLRGDMIWVHLTPSSSFQTVAPTPTTDRTCAYKTKCCDGEYESTPATSTSDATCGTVKQCTGVTTQTAPPTATTDRECSP